MNVQEIRSLGQRLLENMGKVIVGKEEVLELTLTALLAGGHILLEDVPGTGKTTLAKALAASLDGSYKRLQFTPDLLPTDVTGQSIFQRDSGEFTFRPGPVFTNVLLADELNRATPRTQSALLEAMEEHQVSMDGQTRPLAEPFFVIATQNPIETQGTFPLPEAQLDRFLMRVSIGYTDHDQSVRMLGRFLGRSPLPGLQAAGSVEQLLRARAAVEQVQVDEAVRDYIVSLAEATRGEKKVMLGVSPRGMLALMRAGQARAALRGRGYVTPQDVKRLLPHVFCHRVLLRGAYTKQGEETAELLREIADRVPVPTEDPDREK